jgi:AcrR family transcriptional regulator
MHQEERSRLARIQITEAALKLFSHQGYRGTSIRDIAREAGISTGNVYHHFPDKETLFRALLDEYWAALEKPDHPINRALAAGAFPDDLEALGRAARASVEMYRPYVALIYVDVVEFEGEHIRKFYETMAQRFERFLAQHGELRLEKKLQPGIAPLSAIMLTSRIFLNYFAVEVLFGVPNHFGKASEDVIGEIADILRRGLLREARVKREDRRPALPATA